MKTIIFATLLVLALTSAIEFEQDTGADDFIGILTKGFFNPAATGEAKIQTFLRLANELIPLAQVEAEANSPAGDALTFSKSYCTSTTGSIFNACVNATAELWVGWNVNQTGEVGNFGVTYTPFTYFRAGLNAYVESYPAEIGYGVFINIWDITLPIFASVGQTKICYSGSFILGNGILYTQITTALLECSWHVTVSPTDKVCNRVLGPNFKHLTYNLWNG